MTKKYIEEVMWTPELEKSLSESKVLPMVRDICHSYDLKVSQRRLVKYKKYDGGTVYSYKLSVFPLDDRQNDNKYCPYEDEDKPNDQTIKSEFESWQDFEGFVLAHKGVDVALVCIDNHNQYCFHANYEIKERGNSDWDRRTIRSQKLSQVLRSLKRKKYVPIRANWNDDTGSYDNGSPTFIFNNRINTRDMCYKYTAEITRTGEHKTLSDLTQDYERQVHDLTSDRKDYLSDILLCLFKDKTAIPHDISEHYTKQLKEIDKYRDDINEGYQQVKQEMDNGFIAIGVSNNVGYLVGEVSQNPEARYVDKTGNHKYGIDFREVKLESIQRVRQLDDLPFYDSLKPTLAMLKLKLEDWSNKFDKEVYRDYYKSYISYGDSRWFEDIGCYYPSELVTHKTSITGTQWLLMPKPKF